MSVTSLCLVVPLDPLLGALLLASCVYPEDVMANLPSEGICAEERQGVTVDGLLFAMEAGVFGFAAGLEDRDFVADDAFTFKTFFADGGSLDSAFTIPLPAVCEVAFLVREGG